MEPRWEVHAWKNIRWIVVRKLQPTSWPPVRHAKDERLIGSEAELSSIQNEQHICVTWQHNETVCPINE